VCAQNSYLFSILMISGSDDEYRLLRQNLFERFASASEVPSEIPIVPAVRPRPITILNSPKIPNRGRMHSCSCVYILVTVDCIVI